MNIAVISGNLTYDPDIRKTGNGTPVLNFVTAVDHTYRDSTGESRSETSYIHCVIFGNLADRVFPMLGKGARVVVKGRLNENRWQKDGENKSRIELVVEDIDIEKRKRDTEKRDYGYPDEQYGEY